MAMPASIQRQVDQAAQIEQAIAAQAQAAQVQTEAEVAQQPTEATEAEAPPVAETPSKPQAPAPVTAKSGDDPNSETWQQRYRSLQGTFNSQVPKLQQEVQRLNDELAKAQDRISTLSKVVEPTAATAQVTDKDVEEFGPEIIDLVRRVVAKEIAAAEQRVVLMVDGKLAVFERKLGGVVDTVQLTAEEKFYAEVAKEVPDWKDLNVDPGMLDWLAQFDPLIGGTRQELLTQHHQRLNAPGVIAVFKAYKETLPKPAPSSPQVNAELQRQVAPSRSRQPTQQVQPQAKIWTAREWGDAFESIRRREVVGEAAARLEAELDAAMAEGRVSP